MKLNIVGFSEYELYPNVSDKFFHINVELISDSGAKHPDEISVSKDNQGYFHWIKSDELVEQVDINSDYKLSNCILKYCYEKIR